MILEEFKDTLINKGYADLGRLKAMYMYRLSGEYFIIRIHINTRHIEELKISWQRHLANMAEYNNDFFN